MDLSVRPPLALAALRTFAACTVCRLLLHSLFSLFSPILAQSVCVWRVAAGGSGSIAIAPLAVVRHCRWSVILVVVGPGGLSRAASPARVVRNVESEGNRARPLPTQMLRANHAYPLINCLLTLSPPPDVMARLNCQGRWHSLQSSPPAARTRQWEWHAQGGASRNDRTSAGSQPHRPSLQTRQNAPE